MSVLGPANASETFSHDCSQAHIAMHCKNFVASHRACIHAAAMKRIEKCEKDPDEAIKTNVMGTMNVASALKLKFMAINWVARNKWPTFLEKLGWQRTYRIACSKR